LAGLILGIALRQRDVPVTIWEAGHYPRHRVCGEFICGRGMKVLNALNLIEPLSGNGARKATTTAFFAGRNGSPVLPLPEAALCLSRFTLDATLANEFRRRGGELQEGKRWTDSTTREGVVVATGRRAQTRPGAWHWFGLKAHARNVELAADLELHLTSNGYVGVCKLSEGVNVCGLFRRRRNAAQRSPREEMLVGPPGSALFARLENSEFVPDSFCAIGGLDLRPPHDLAPSECRIGDALTMIPPFTGNGMSMALEAAALATDPLEQWSLGQTAWAEACQRIASCCDEAFRRRLVWSNRLHTLMFFSLLHPPLIRTLARWPRAWDFLFSHTR
jgi:flavin-dependent dehydrogenase